MTQLVSAAGERYDHGPKGHDRIYTDNENGLYAVFDGAGGDSLSDRAVRALPGLADKPLVDVFMQLSHLSAEHNSTAVMTRVTDLPYAVEVEYLCAGDSWLVLFDPRRQQDNGLVVLGHQYETRVQVDSRWLISTKGFLAGEIPPRSPQEVKRMIGTAILSKEVPWRLLLMTDGVMGDGGEGLDMSRLSDLCKWAQPERLPEALIKAIQPKYDDAAVVAIYPKDI